MTQKRSLGCLPSEIVFQITRDLGQIDVLNLMRTGPCMYEPCLKRIYETVIIDTSYTEFSEEYDIRFTYINSIYTMKRFLQTERAKYIKHLHVIDLPSSLCDLVPNEYFPLLPLFSNLYSLHGLMWLTHELAFDQLAVLPNLALLTTLQLNVNCITQTRFEQSKPDMELPYLDICCPNLRHLSIKPFKSSQRLLYMMNCILKHNQSDVVPLVSLRLARFNTFESMLASVHEHPQVNPLSALAASEMEINTIEKLMVSKFAMKFRYVTELSLDSFFVNGNDAILLIQNITLSRLKTLSLKNISEHGYPPEEASGKGFLLLLAPHLKTLSHLCLDCRETTRETTLQFLLSIKPLTSLDFIARYRAHEIRDPSVFDVDIAFAMSNHNLLEKLSIEVRCERLSCESPDPTPGPIIARLNEFLKLRSLRLSYPNIASQETFTSILRCLPKLRFLDVFNVDVGFEHNLGLIISRPILYDEYSCEENHAYKYWNYQPKLDYVRINDCIFECNKDELIPRATIDRWFEQNVRV